MKHSPNPLWKYDKPSAKLQRELRRTRRESHESSEKAKVRRRDRGCRFPYCSCKKKRVRLEVSHSEHKGSGGNPDGSRSAADLMVQLCEVRHKGSPVSIDRGAIRWHPLTPAGSDGPIGWQVDMNLVAYLRGHNPTRPSEPRWVLIAEELAPGRVVQPSPYQWDVLMWLADNGQF